MLQIKMQETCTPEGIWNAQYYNYIYDEKYIRRLDLSKSKAQKLIMLVIFSNIGLLPIKAWAVMRLSKIKTWAYIRGFTVCVYLVNWRSTTCKEKANGAGAKYKSFF